MISPTVDRKTEQMKPLGRPHMSTILASGRMQRPDMRLDTILTVAVKECSWNELVTYGVSAADMLLCNAVTK